MEGYVFWQRFNVILDGDAMEIVHALWNNDQSWSRYGNLIDDAKILLHSLQLWHVMHTKWEANMAAHLMAKAALQQSVEEIWMEDYHVFLHNIVISESCMI